MKKVLNNKIFTNDFDKKIKYICKVSGNCNELISLLERKIDVDINGKNYVNK